MKRKRKIILSSGIGITILIVAALAFSFFRPDTAQSMVIAQGDYTAVIEQLTTEIAAAMKEVQDVMH